jgi:hypothetical protein
MRSAEAAPAQWKIGRISPEGNLEKLGQEA